MFLSIVRIFFAMSIPWVGAMRYVENGEEKIVYTKTIDCSPLKPASVSMTKAFLTSLRSITSPNFGKFESPDDCSAYFVYRRPQDQFFRLYSRPSSWKENGTVAGYTCSICAFDHDFECYRQVCNATKSGNLWDYLTQSVPAACARKLCNLAKTGEWERGGWFTHRRSKKKPWHATMPGHKGIIGYQDAFKSKCWHGPKQFDGVLGDFQTLAERYDLITPNKTFNKKACGCPTTDEC